MARATARRALAEKTRLGAVARQQLNRFERRDATALRRNRRAVERQATDVRDSVESRANGLQSRATEVVERVRSVA